MSAIFNYCITILLLYVAGQVIGTDEQGNSITVVSGVLSTGKDSGKGGGAAGRPGRKRFGQELHTGKADSFYAYPALTANLHGNSLRPGSHNKTNEMRRNQRHQHISAKNVLAVRSKAKATGIVKKIEHKLQNVTSKTVGAGSPVVNNRTAVSGNETNASNPLVEDITNITADEGGNENSEVVTSTVVDEKKNESSAVATNITLGENKNESSAVATNVTLDEKKNESSAVATNITSDEKKNESSAVATNITLDDKKNESSAVATSTVVDEKKNESSAVATSTVVDEKKNESSAVATSITLDEKTNESSAVATSITVDEKKNDSSTVVDTIVSNNPAGDGLNGTSTKNATTADAREEDKTSIILIANKTDLSSTNDTSNQLLPRLLVDVKGNTTDPVELQVNNNTTGNLQTSNPLAGNETNAIADSSIIPTNLPDATLDITTIAPP